MDHGRSLEESKKLGPQSSTTVIRQHIDFTWLILRRGWKTSLGERTYYHCTAGYCALHSCFIKETWSTGKLRVIMDAGLNNKFWFVQDAKMGPRAMLVLQNRRTCPSTYFSQQRKTFPKEQVQHKRNISSKWSAEDRTKKPFAAWALEPLIVIRLHQGNAYRMLSKQQSHPCANYIYIYKNNNIRQVIFILNSCTYPKVPEKLHELIHCFPLSLWRILVRKTQLYIT